MTDRVYPSAKPNSLPPQSLNGTTTTSTNPSFPPSKAQLYGATRPTYRPQPKPQRRHRRGCCCCCCLWTTLLVIALLLLIAIAGAIFWVLYRPQRPSFSVTTLRISQFNITTGKNSSPRLNSKIDLTVSVRNPNKKISYFYDPISITVNSNGIDIGDGSFPTFVHGSKNTTVLKTSVTSAAKELDSDSNKLLSADLKKKSGLPLEIELDTKVQVKVGSFKSKKVGIKVTCTGIRAIFPKGKAASSSSIPPSSDPKCKVNLRIKIWKWTF